MRLAVDVAPRPCRGWSSRLDEAPCVFARFADPAIANRVGVASALDRLKNAYLLPCSWSDGRADPCFLSRRGASFAQLRSRCQRQCGERFAAIPIVGGLVLLDDRLGDEEEPCDGLVLAVGEQADGFYRGRARLLVSMHARSERPYRSDRPGKLSSPGSARLARRLKVPVRRARTPRDAEGELVGFRSSLSRGSVSMPAQSLNRVVWVLSLREDANLRARRCEITQAPRDHLRVFLVIPSDVRAWAGDHRLHPSPVGLVADADSRSIASGHIANLASRGKPGKGSWFPSP